MAYPLVTIQRIFQKPPEIVICTVCKNYAELRAATDGLRQLEDEKRVSLGYAPSNEVPGIALNSKYPVVDGENPRTRLHKSMTTDHKWIDLYIAAVGSSDGEPVEPYEKLAKYIYLPDWNEIAAVVHEVGFEGNKVIGEFGSAHSYITQLKEKEKMQDGIEPVSVYGNVRTCGKNTIMGVRGGSRFKGGHMTTPAGSLKVYDKNGEPYADMRKCIQRELEEELGLRLSKKVKIGNLIGVFRDPIVRGFVFDVPTDLSFVDIKKIWEESVDRKEHEYLFPRRLQGTLEYISENADRRDGIEPVVDPQRLLLPSGVSVLSIGAGYYSKEYFDTIMKSLGGLFVAEEDCFPND